MLEVRLSCQSNIPPVFQVESPLTDSPKTRFSPGSITTDPVLWRAIIANLLGNAVTYAPGGSTLRISASPRVFAVENEAPDLDPGDLDRLFERFWRKSSSRTEKGHSGLGLSVVRAAVTFLGGECSASLDGAWLRVEVRWPGTTV